MKTLDKIRAVFATRPGRMPSEAWRRAALTLMSERALTISDAEFDQLAVTLGITGDVAALEAAERASERPARAERAPATVERSAASERGAA